jgi:hypothetical protein
MNIKSLLLGSAAALVAVSGARAADAVEVVAEPEPMEYVRICDTYGTGFYYIPGTETCLRVGGYIRYDIGVGDLFGVRTIDKQDVLVGGVLDHNDTYYKRARAALQLDARTETELGTLRGYMHINFNYDTDGNGIRVGGIPVDIAGIDGVSDASDNWGINHAYIELGGFRIGKTDSYFTTFTDYAGGVINDDLVGYGPFGTHQIAYTFDAGNGLTAGVALETGDGNFGLGDQPFVAGTTVPASINIYTIDSYIPHVVAGVGYTAGWGGVKLVGGYDSVWEEFAAKLRVDVKASEALSLFVMGGWRSNGDGDASNPLAFNYYGNWGGDWAVWGGATFQASEKAAVNVQLSYDEAENFAAVANVAYTVVPGFTITPEVAYVDNFDADDADAFGGFLRFQRNF